MCFFDSYSKSEKILPNRVSVYGAFFCLVLPSSFSSKININKKTRQEPCFNQPITYFVTKRWAYWFLTLCKQSTEAWRWANCFNFGEPELFKLDLGDKIWHLITKSRGKGCFQCHMPTPWLTRISSTRGLKIFTRSPPWCRGGLLDLWSKGQQFEPRRRQLEKIVNLDENSWTPMDAGEKITPA